MSNGSARSSGGSRSRRAPHRSLGLGKLLLGCFAILSGCHHATLHPRPNLQAELSAVTVDDLLFLAASHARAGDLLRAEQYLSAVRQRGHDEATVVYWLVRVCVAASRYQSALGHASTYLRDHPGDWALRLVVATIYEALGDVARAQSELERIVGTEPLMPLPHYRLAMLYRDRHADQERARQHLREYLQLNPEGPHAAEVRSLLAQVVAASVGPRLLPSSFSLDGSEEEVP